MSGPGVTVVDADQLRLAAPGFDDAGDALAAAMSTLQGALAAEQGCWGADEPGETFATPYRPAEQAAAQGFEALVEALHQVRTALDGAADEFDETERAIAHGLGGRR